MSVASITASTVAFGRAISGLVVGRLISASASGPSASKRSRQRLIVGRLTPSSRAICKFEMPLAAISTMCARWAMLFGVVKACVHRSSLARSRRVIDKGLAGLHMYKLYNISLSKSIRETLH